MLETAGLRLLVSAEALLLFAAFTCWWRVWKAPGIDQLRMAALFSCILMAFSAVSLSIGIMATTR